MIRYIDIHTHRAAPGVLAVVSLPAGAGAPSGGTLFSAGIHPWDAGSADLDRALEYLRTTPAAAIGEVGLDFAHAADRQTQERVLRPQLGIAQDRGLPVVVHCVKAYNEMLGILADYNLRAVIFHSYVGSPQQTETIIGRGYYVSAGPVSLRSPKTLESLAGVPLDRLLAETDDSGEDIRDVYAKLAAATERSLDELAAAMESNFKTIFG